MPVYIIQYDTTNDRKTEAGADISVNNILEPMYSSNLNSAEAFKQHLREKQHPEC